MSSLVFAETAARRLFTLSLLSVVSLLVGVGCAWNSDSAPRSAFEKYGGVKQDQAVSPIDFKIVKPTEGAEYRPDEPIECIIALRVSDESQLPTVLHAVLWDADERVVYGDVYPEPLEDPSGEEHRFKATLKAPNQPGRYKIRADGVDYVFTPDGENGKRETVEVAADETPILVVQGDSG